MSSDSITRACPACGMTNPADATACRRCGQEFTAGERVPEDATIRFTGKLPLPEHKLARATPVENLFATRNQVVIGRAPDCDITLPHPSVSRRHAVLDRLPEGLRLRDLDSLNGVFVGGQRIAEPVLIREQERVGIGPFMFCLSGGVIYSLDNSRSLRLEARHVEKVVPTEGKQVLKLLDDINLAIDPGEFVSLLGPSGSGKSTLMDCLNGRRPATGGSVLANGEDFYRHFDNFRQSLGYVPQRDIVHNQLTVYRALYYTARLRLPTDTSSAELETRINEVIDQMELQPHRHTVVANLSGGQVKRVSLGAELLARPCLLYIDEATSGLDAGTEARMMRLFRHLANEGKSVICITHNVDNVDACNLVLLLSRGKLAFIGPPAEARTYFDVDRLSDIYDRLGEKDPEVWQKQFAATSLYKDFVEARLESAGEDSNVLMTGQQGLAVPPPVEAVSVSQAATPEPAPSSAGRPRFRPPLWHQFVVLTRRYGELVWSDRHSLRLLMFQGPIVALFLLLGFLNKPYQEEVPAPRPLEEWEKAALQQAEPAIEQADRSGKSAELLRGILNSKVPVVPDRMIVDPRYTYTLLFIMVIAILWFGCNNAAKEIVKEEAIYGRERSVNLGILPYLASKFLILSLVSAIQVLLVCLVVYGVLEALHYSPWHLEAPPPLYRLGYLEQYAVLVLLSVTGVALGLLLSACVSSTDRANTLLPYVLIPQIILGGGIMPVKHEPLHIIALVASPAYWGFRAIRRGATHLPESLPQHMDYNDSVWLACAALGVQIVVLLLLTAWFLKRKDVIKA